MSYSDKCCNPCGWGKKEYTCSFYLVKFAEREYECEDKYEDDYKEEDCGWKPEKCEKPPKPQPEEEKFCCKCRCWKVEEKPKCPPCEKEKKKPEYPCFCKQEKPKCPCKKDDFEDKCEEKKERHEDCKWVRFYDKPCECSHGGWFGISYKPDDHRVY